MHELDPDCIQPPTEAQQAELDALASQEEGQVDTSEIPPLSDAFWTNAVRNPFHRPARKQLTVRLDADVLAWLRSSGPGYQTKLNDILRRAMLHEAPKG